jgi:tetratricopeptide (TPR) repeat protein
MGRLTARFLALFRRWDAASRLAFILAFVLLIPAVLIAASGPQEVRGIALGSVIGLIISAQLIFMWANRTMVTNYVAAQRAFLIGDFEQTRAILEPLATSGKARAPELTLLGNTYRQLGDLDASETTLLQALEQEPEHPFPLYGLGKTQLVQGHYAEAIQTIAHALDMGAPAVVTVDLLEARYRDGDVDLARDLLDDAEAAAALDESYRRLLVAYLRHRLDEGPPPDADLIRDGLPFWDAEVLRYALTPYAEALKQDVDHLREL